MSEDSQRSYDLYEKMAPILNNLQAINNNFEHQKKQISTLTYTVDKLHLQTKNRDIDEKNLQWLYSLQQRENQLVKEIHQHEAQKAHVDQLKEQSFFLQQQVKSLTDDNAKLRQQLLLIQQKNEALIAQQETALKMAIKDVNESFITRITQLEAQLMIYQKDGTESVLQMNSLANKVKLLEQQKNILQGECDQFELVKQTLVKEKELYLNEFRFLKENYFKTIDKLQEEVHKLKVQNHTLSEDNKSLQQTCEYYKQRFQDMLDLQEIATMNNDSSLLGLLKHKGMENVTKADVQQVRDELLQDMAMRQQFQFDNVWDRVISDINNIG